MERNQTSALEPYQGIDVVGIIGLSLYILFTLLSDSSSLQASWNWILIQQIGLMVPWIWLIREFWRNHNVSKLGFGLDLGVGLCALGLIIAPFFSIFNHQVIFNSWITLSCLLALYAVSHVMRNPHKRQKFLRWQGVLSSIFISMSLLLWGTQTFLPEFIRLQDLRSRGVKVAYDFSLLELRNWAPIGHQNYVAGYLVLSIPLLLGLCINAQKKLSRLLWGVFLALGLLDLYTTSSRGGWLGLAVIALLGCISLIENSKMAVRQRILMMAVSLATLVLIILSNNRLRRILDLTSLNAIGGESAFRVITNLAGWQMGLAQPIFGAGPGSVSLQYQAYRPSWAGQEAEWVYQLHSTPAQIWAEFGLFGSSLTAALIIWILYWGIKLWRSPQLIGPDRVFVWSLLSGFAGYAFIALTDYQLDIAAIVGTLILYLAGLISVMHGIFTDRATSTQRAHSKKLVSIGMAGILIAIGLWITPVLRAWQLSSLSLSNLQGNNIGGFKANLKQAHQLAPWEPYYLHQLAWNLGNLGLQSPEEIQRKQYLEESQRYFKESIEVSPNQEFAYSNLGWLQFVTGQAEATQTLNKASHLVPGKRLAFHSLGLSLLQQGRNDEAIQAFSLEILRNPIWLTSPVWRSAQLQSIEADVQELTKQRYKELLSTTQDIKLLNYLDLCLGSLYWWQGDLENAAEQWKKSENRTGLQLISILRGESSSYENREGSKESKIFQAWAAPHQRQEYVEQALLISTKAPPEDNQVNAILAGMKQAKTLDEWIKSYTPINEYRRTRNGFGVLSRHIDGPAPIDYVPIVDNLVVTLFFDSFFPNQQFNAALDKSIQPYREKLWNSIDS